MLNKNRHIKKDERLIFSCIMLKKAKHIFKTFARFLKYVWPFFNIMHKRVNLENLGESADLI